MTIITPGVVFILQGFTYYGFFAASVLCLNSIVASYTDFDALSTWVLLVGTLLSIPIGSIIYVLSCKLLHIAQAKSVGARIIPELAGKLPGNFDTLKTIIEKTKYGYPGGFEIFEESFLSETRFR